MDIWCGCDLGKLVDYTALSLMTRALAIDFKTKMPMRTSKGIPLYRFDLVRLIRFRLGTPYTAIVNRVSSLVTRPEFQPIHLVLDATGVGNPVAELFKTALRKHPGVLVHTISITGGRTWSHVGHRAYNVAKIELVSTVKETLVGRRLRVSRDKAGKPIKFAGTLKTELANFREKISEAGNDVFETRQGQHDDLVLSVALPVWLGSQRHMEMQTRTNQRLRLRERRAVSAEQIALEEAETTATKLEAAEMVREDEERRDRQHEAHERDLNSAYWGWTNFDGSDLDYNDD